MKSFSYINRNDISANWALINVDQILKIGFKLENYYTLYMVGIWYIANVSLIF